LLSLIIQSNLALPKVSEKSVLLIDAVLESTSTEPERVQPMNKNFKNVKILILLLLIMNKLLQTMLCDTNPALNLVWSISSNQIDAIADEHEYRIKMNYSIDDYKQDYSHRLHLQKEIVS
jgi:hypothetical protein